VSGYGINPLIESRIKFCNNVLFPMRSHKPKEYFRLVDRILKQVLKCRDRARYDMCGTYDCPQRDGQYLNKLDERNKV